MTEPMDMRTLIPIERHKTLLKTFKELPVGDHFIFINDHDPIPLYYEFKSIYGDVVGWEYLNKGGRDWQVKVTRTEASQGREFKDISTLMDLRKAEADKWKQVVFHRYGMMENNDTMEIIAALDPTEIVEIFTNKFKDKCELSYLKKEEGEFVIHVKKTVPTGLGEDGFSVVNTFDVRPYPPSQRHDMFYDAFNDIKPGEAFEFVNDHDPKPLYYQMEAESKEPFIWEYLEKGPVDWKVRVIKTKSPSA